MTEAAAGILAPEQVEAWNRDGFLVLDSFVDDDTLAALRTAYDEIIAKDVEASGDRMLGGITRQVMLPGAAHAAFGRNPVVRKGISIGRQLFGTDDVVRTFDIRARTVRRTVTAAPTSSTSRRAGRSATSRARADPILRGEVGRLCRAGSRRQSYAPARGRSRSSLRRMTSTGQVSKMPEAANSSVHCGLVDS